MIAVYQRVILGNVKFRSRLEAVGHGVFVDRPLMY